MTELSSCGKSPARSAFLGPEEAPFKRGFRRRNRPAGRPTDRIVAQGYEANP